MTQMLGGPAHLKILNLTVQAGDRIHICDLDVYYQATGRVTAMGHDEALFLDPEERMPERELEAVA